MKALIKKQLFEGKFEIQGEIAKGQSGTILYGYDLGLRQEVAIKIYHSHINGRLIRGKTFIEKSKPLLLIDHPNLIKIFKVEEEADNPVVFMEFFDAPSLQQRIHDKGPMPVQDMLRLAREITEVLVHIHFQGIIHGTLHPGHVLVGPQGQVKVLDLGLSWILMDILSNCDVELLRPLPYLLPEIAKEELLNVSSDLYCLGFMMYEMLTGTVPYAGLPKTSIMGKLSFDQSDPVFDFPDSVPEVICDLIREMTRNKAQERLQDSTHVLTIINQQLTKLPLSKKSTLLPSSSPQPQTPGPKVPNKVEGISAPSKPEPTPPTIPSFKRPQVSVNYSQVTRTTMLRKTSITIGIIVLIGLAGALGYWYRDILEPHFSILQEQSNTSPQGTSLPQTIPLESEPPIVPAQDSVNIQESLSRADELPQKEIQQLTPKNEIKDGALSSPTSLSPQPDGQPNQTQLPKSEKAKPKQSLAPTQKQPVFQRPTTVRKQEPSKITPGGPKSVLSPTTKAIKKAPTQKPISPQQPNGPKAKQGTSPASPQKQPVLKQRTTPIEQETSKIDSAGTQKALSPTAKTIKKMPAQKSVSPQPVVKKAKPTLTLPQKQPGTNQSLTPTEKLLSNETPTNTKVTPIPAPKAPIKDTLKSAVPIESGNTTINKKKESALSTPSSEDITTESTDQEVEELLQSLDEPSTDSSSITVP